MTPWDFSAAWPDDGGMCRQFVDALSVTGAAVSVFAGSMAETSVCASDSIAARLDELQFDLGEGPRWEAARTRVPVFVPRLQDDLQPSWPVFATEVRGMAAEALFVFPLTIGALDIGVVELYCSWPGGLPVADQLMAAALADSMAWSLAGQLLNLDEKAAAESPKDASPLARREIHQATGMVLVQAGITATEALLLLRSHAFSHGRTVRDVARDVVAKRIDFHPERS